MQKIMMGLVVSIFALLSFNARADERQETVYLTQILNQLNAIQPFILAAQKAQPTNGRIQFHYMKYRDSKGAWHNGLLEDVNAIKAGITQKLNGPVIEPRVINPLKGDYFSQPNSNSDKDKST
jgi:RAQPRD family integrative conjugative element protein